LLAAIEIHEDAIGRRRQVFVLREIVGSQGHTPHEFGQEL
jgi:hypothetical protein